jgi:hypothetical protein
VVDFPVAAQDILEIIGGMAVLIALIMTIRWFRRAPRRWWHLALPSVAWLLNELALFVVIISMETGGARVAVNVWSLVCHAQGVATLAWYLWIMAHDDGSH